MTYRCIACGSPGVELSADALALLEESNKTLDKLRRPRLSPAEVAICTPCYRRRR